MSRYKPYSFHWPQKPSFFLGYKWLRPICWRIETYLSWCFGDSWYAHVDNSCTGIASITGGSECWVTVSFRWENHKLSQGCPSFERQSRSINGVVPEIALPHERTINDKFSRNKLLVGILGYPHLPICWVVGKHLYRTAKCLRSRAVRCDCRDFRRWWRIQPKARLSNSTMCTVSENGIAKPGVTRLDSDDWWNQIAFTRFHIVVECLFIYMLSRPFLPRVGFTYESSDRIIGHSSQPPLVTSMDTDVSGFLVPWGMASGDDFDTTYYDDMFYDDTEETQDMDWLELHKGGMFRACSFDQLLASIGWKFLKFSATWWNLQLFSIWCFLPSFRLKKTHPAYLMLVVVNHC